LSLQWIENPTIILQHILPISDRITREHIYVVCFSFTSALPYSDTGAATRNTANKTLNHSRYVVFMRAQFENK